MDRRHVLLAHARLQLTTLLGEARENHDYPQRSFLSTTEGVWPRPGATCTPRSRLGLKKCNPAPLRTSTKPNAMGMGGRPACAHAPSGRVGRNSTAFRSAYCSNPICAPSRASILTGLYTHHHGTGRTISPGPRGSNCRAITSAAPVTYPRLSANRTSPMDRRTGSTTAWTSTTGSSNLGPKTQLYADELPKSQRWLWLPSGCRRSGNRAGPWKDTEKPPHVTPSTQGGRSDARSDHFDSWVARESIRFLSSHAASNRSS